MSSDIKEKINKRCEKSLLQVKVSKIDLIYLINPAENEVVKMDNLKKRRRCLVIFFIIIILSIVGTVFFGFFACNEEICAFSKKKLLPDHHYHQYQLSHQLDNLSSLNKHKLDSHLKGLSYDEVLNDDFQSRFDINKFDVMVSLFSLPLGRFIILVSTFKGFPAHTKGETSVIVYLSPTKKRFPSRDCCFVDGFFIIGNPLITIFTILDGRHEFWQALSPWSGP